MPQALLANRFELLECLREDGDSAIYLASDHKEREALKSLQVYVGLKVISAEILSSGATREIGQTVACLSALKHPNLLRPYEFVEAPGLAAISGECPRGPSLEELLKYHTFGVRIITRILRQVLEAILIVRDAKPQPHFVSAAAIYLTESGEVKLDPLNFATSTASAVAETADLFVLASMGILMLDGKLSDSAPPLRRLLNRVTWRMRAKWRRRKAEALQLETILRRALASASAGQVYSTRKMLSEIEVIDDAGAREAEATHSALVTLASARINGDIVSAATLFLGFLALWCLGILLGLSTLMRIF